MGKASRRKDDDSYKREQAARVMARHADVDEDTAVISMEGLPFSWGNKPRADKYCKQWEANEVLLGRAAVFTPIFFCWTVWAVRREFPSEFMDVLLKGSLLMGLVMLGLGLLQLGFSRRRQRILSRASNAVPPSPEQAAEAQPQPQGTSGRPRKRAPIEQ